MKKTKITLLTQWFDPEPTFKGLLFFAKGLSKKGFEVTVVTGFPNYPGGNLYPGYKIQIYRKEIIDNITIVRLPLYPSHSKSIIGRVLNYLSFVFHHLYTQFFMPKVDVIYGYHPPLTIGIVLSLVRVFRKIPVVYDIQDLWPDSLKATGMFSSEIGMKNCKYLFVIGFIQKLI